MEEEEDKRMKRLGTEEEKEERVKEEEHQEGVDQDVQQEQEDQEQEQEDKLEVAQERKDGKVPTCLLTKRWASSLYR